MMTNLRTSPTADYIIGIFSHSKCFVQTIIFQTWGLELLHLSWFNIYSVHKIAKMPNLAMKTNLMASLLTATFSKRLSTRLDPVV